MGTAVVDKVGFFIYFLAEKKIGPTEVDPPLKYDTST